MKDGSNGTPAAAARDGATPTRLSPVGRVGTPRNLEATTEQFYFWVPEDRLVEKTQLVQVESRAGPETVKFYGLVTEVLRRSRRADILEESDRFDGRPEEDVRLDSRGVTYAQVRVLSSDPPIFAPPREESLVFAATEEDARRAYSVDEMSKPLVIGLVRNGGQAVAGPAFIDLDYVLGALGGHINVSGIAGVGTKSSFLTIVLQQILRYCQRHAEEHPEDPEKLQVRPVILNVKGFDLFWLDRWSKAFTEDDRETWRQMGWDDPRPFETDYYAPQRPRGEGAVADTGRHDAKPYSWSLADIVRESLFAYLFSDSDREDDNFALLVADIDRLLTRERRQADGTPSRDLREDAPARTFDELFGWFERGLAREAGQDAPPERGDERFAKLAGTHHPGTLRRFYRRLRRIVYESAGIFRLEDGPSHPLDLKQVPVGRPIVVDIQALPDRHLQRFVVAALLKQAQEHQTGAAAVRGLHYVFLLDELNRFAPKGHSDPITQLIETVAAELRSRGVILLGAQQQASLVSTRVVENSAVRVLGRSGGHELRQDVFSFLPESLREYVEQLTGADKVVHQPSFREPMNVRVPRPPWAMRRAEADTEPPAFLKREGVAAAETGPKRLKPRPYEELP